LGCDTRLHSELHVHADLHEEINEQPHVVQQDSEPEFKQSNTELLRCRVRRELLDLLVSRLNPTPAVVPFDLPLGLATIDRNLIVNRLFV